MATTDRNSYDYTVRRIAETIEIVCKFCGRCIGFQANVELEEDTMWFSCTDCYVEMFKSIHRARRDAGTE